jgi:hypothetical protein
MDFARQEARGSFTFPREPASAPAVAQDSPARAPSEAGRGGTRGGGVRRESGERGENGRRSPGSQLGFPYQTGGNGPSGPGRPFLARIKETQGDRAGAPTAASWALPASQLFSLDPLNFCITNRTNPHRKKNEP